MKINKILLIVFLFFTSFFYAQNKGISYQAVFYNPEVKSYPGQDVSTTPLAETDICLRFTILDESKLMEYEETLKVKTDKYGMVTTSIGTGTKIGGYANSFDQIVWGAANKILAVSVDKSGYCNSFIPVSESSFDAVPFSFSSISAVHVSGVVGVNNGGTGAVDAAVARVNLGAESVANKSTDINADWDSDVKFPSVKSIKKYVDLQTSAGGYGNGSITNEKLAVDAVTDEKVATGINKSKVGLDQVDNTSDLAKPISTDTKAYVDAQVASVVVSDGSITDEKVATGINKSKVGLDQVDNTSDAAKPISTDTQTALDTKANTESPEFTGVPTVPTAGIGVTTNQVANAAFVAQEIKNHIQNFVTVTGDYTVLPTDNIILIEGDNDITITIPSSGLYKGKQLTYFWYDPLDTNSVSSVGHALTFVAEGGTVLGTISPNLIINNGSVLMCIDPVLNIWGALSQQ
jgi:hypothetical protein